MKKIVSLFSPDISLFLFFTSKIISVAVKQVFMVSQTRLDKISLQGQNSVKCLKIKQTDF